MTDNTELERAREAVLRELSYVGDEKFDPALAGSALADLIRLIAREEIARSAPSRASGGGGGPKPCESCNGTGLFQGGRASITQSFCQVCGGTGYAPSPPSEPAQATKGEPPETILKAVERILDEHSAWIARPNADVTRAVALSAGIAWSLHENARIAELERENARVTKDIIETELDYQAAEAALADIRELLDDIKTWANSRCPCENDQPNPCPLCGADANKASDICLAAENTVPKRLLARIDLALLTPSPTARGTDTTPTEDATDGNTGGRTNGSNHHVSHHRRAPDVDGVAQPAGDTDTPAPAPAADWSEPGIDEFDPGSVARHESGAAPSRAAPLETAKPSPEERLAESGRYAPETIAQTLPTSKGGFIDGNGRCVTRGDRVEYQFGGRGVVGEIMHDGDADVTFDGDEGTTTVKWVRLCKIDTPAPAPDWTEFDSWPPESQSAYLAGRILVALRQGNAALVAEGHGDGWEHGFDADLLRQAEEPLLRAIRHWRTPAPAPDMSGAVEALRELEAAEREYRLAHDSFGGDHPTTGRRWDVLRRKGDRARAALATLQGGTDG